MQPQQLILRLNNILNQPNPSTHPTTNNPPSFHQQTTTFIKQSFNQLYLYSSQQIIKLSACYQAKLQCQAASYEQQITYLKSQTQRQYKIIGLMRLELQDLVVLVNQQRNRYCKGCNQRINNEDRSGDGDGQDDHDRDQERVLREDEENKQWRVKKSSSAMVYTQKTHTNPNTLSNSSNTQNQTSDPHQSRPSGSLISGLQIITQEETQRTLMSAGDQEQYPIEPDYFQTENDQNQHLENVENFQQQNPHFDAEPVNMSKEMNQMEAQDRIKSHQQKGLNQQQVVEEQIKQEQKQLKQVDQFREQVNCNNIKPEEQNPNETENFNQSINLSQSQQSLNQNSNPWETQEKTTNNNIHETKTTFNHPHLTYIPSIKPQIRYTQNSQKSSNFVKNPFAKKVPESKQNPHYFTQKPTDQYTFFNESPNNSNSYTQQQSQESERTLQPSKSFLKQYRPEFVTEINHHSSKPNSKPKSKNTSSSVMSILELIANSNFEPHSKRSQKSQKPPLSKSKSKGKNTQGKKSIQNKSNKSSNTKPKKLSNKKPIYYNHQTQEHVEIDSENNSRFTMVRCPTTQDITSTQRHNPKSFDQTECFTSENFRQHSEYESSCDNNPRSFHTTFGKPSSSEFLRDASSANNLANNREINLNNFFTNQRKGSIKWKKQSLSSKDNFNNKENQRQRRMSQKAPSSKPYTIVSKKASTKYLKPNSSFASEQSVQSMLQSHLENSNKFLVGTKKQQVKYDGERMTLGQQQIRHGHGTLFYSNGLIYEGDFFQNKRQGYGLLKFNHVELYSGEWQNDELSGKGKIRNCAIINKKKKELTEGLTLNSNVNNHQMSSNMFTKWISYCGEFMNNRFEGEGTLYLQGGQKFVGWFRNGVADGEGSLYRKNGQVEDGVWRNNIMIESYGI